MTVTLTPLELWQFRAELAESQHAIDLALAKQRAVIAAWAVRINFNPAASGFSWDVETGTVTVIG